MTNLNNKTSFQHGRLSPCVRLTVLNFVFGLRKTSSFFNYYIFSFGWLNFSELTAFNSLVPGKKRLPAVSENEQKLVILHTKKPKNNGKTSSAELSGAAVSGHERFCIYQYEKHSLMHKTIDPSWVKTGEHSLVRFKVPVHDAIVVEILQSQDRLCKVHPGHIYRQGTHVL